MKKLEKTSLENLKSIYRLTGDDALVIESAEDFIESLLSLQMPELNKTVFSDENFDAEKIILACQQMPFVDCKRLVVVKNITKVKDADLKKLEGYCTNPEPNTILIFREIVSQNVFGKLTAEKVLCNKKNEVELAKMIREEFAKFSPTKTISQNAVDMLIDFCGKDSLRIKNELSKILFSNSNEITEKDIQKMVKKSDEYSVFEITTALSLGQSDKAIVLIKKMLETTDFPVILGLISSHFRRMLYSVLSEGTNAEIANMLGVKEFAVAKAKKLAENISLPNILKINNTILEVDYDIKNGKMSAENAMYYLVFQIIAFVKVRK